MGAPFVESTRPSPIESTISGHVLRVDPLGAKIISLRDRIGDLIFPYSGDEIDGNAVGGSLLLFPQSGKPSGIDGLNKLPVDGFARQLLWRGGPTGAGVDLEFVSDGSLPMFPYQFKVDYSVGLVKVGAGIRLDQTVDVTNMSQSQALPIAPGFRMALPIPVSERKKLRTNLPGFDTGDDFSKARQFTLPDKEIEIELPTMGGVYILLDGPFSRVTLWGLPGIDFIYVAPYSRPSGSLGDVQKGIALQPNRQMTMRLKTVFAR